MDADEIVPLTAGAVRRLLELQQAPVEESEDLDKRAAARWPFPGAVEIWVPDEGGIERHVLGACHNLTDRGVGVRCDEPIETGATLPIAIHQPELSLHGQAMVRHCTMRGQGYLVGFEFVFQAG